jgi:uncharacterized SAM-binding protein YcdF (DUF218 family)
VYYLISWLLDPFHLLFLCLLAAIVNLWRKRVETKRRLLLLTVPFALLYLAATPLVASRLLAILEASDPQLEERPADAQAIVVLSGWLREPDKTNPEPQLGSDSLARCVKGLELYRDGAPLPVLVAGGKVDADRAGPTLARAMGDLLQEIGVEEKHLILEEESTNTFENAVESAKLLKERGLTKVVLVTDATHLPRAVACFERQGLDVTAAPARFRSADFALSLGDLLPSTHALTGTGVAVHEYAGWVWYWLRGRL